MFQPGPFLIPQPAYLPPFTLNVGLITKLPSSLTCNTTQQQSYQECAQKYI